MNALFCPRYFNKFSERDSSWLGLEKWARSRKRERGGGEHNTSLMIANEELKTISAF